ncbi:hypothetical protein ACSLO9_32655, partial [Escherichia coli]
RRGMRAGPLAPVQAATAVEQAVPRYLTGLGTITADEASVASAQLQLDWSRITAPVDGRVGLKQVDVGN